MRLLVLGGTAFLGRHLVALALERGHSVLLMHRGRTNPGLFGEAETIHGDRATDLGKLAGRRFDAVVDTCGYVPRVVREAVEALKERVSNYVFVSSLSVYPTDAWPNVREGSPVIELKDPSVETVTGDTYGGLKALCDQTLLSMMPGRSFVVRPGLIVGPHDPTDRFTYWVRRLARGGDVLAPEPRKRRIKFVDARDLAAFILDGAETGRSGVFNVVGPDNGIEMESLLGICREASGSDARINWVPREFLESQGVQPWSHLPLWIPDIHDDFDCSKALSQGLRTRPVAETVRDTLWWDQLRSQVGPMNAGLSPQREAELLTAWAASGSA